MPKGHFLVLYKPNSVRERGLEPPQVTLLVPKTSASTIPPLTHTINFTLATIHLLCALKGSNLGPSP